MLISFLSISLPDVCSDEKDAEQAALRNENFLQEGPIFDELRVTNHFWTFIGAEAVCSPIEEHFACVDQNANVGESTDAVAETGACP